MPYNPKTALENQKAFLRAQAAKSEYPNIARKAKETLAKIEQREKEAAEINRRIIEFNKKWRADREKMKNRQKRKTSCR